MNDRRLEQRVAAVAEAALSERGFVTAIDVFLGLGWLAPSGEQAWRQGRTPYLERVITANLSRITTAMRCFRAWARRRGLKPSETAYVAALARPPRAAVQQERQTGLERAYRTHWVSPRLSERKRERLAERQSKPPELVVISPVRDWTCSAREGTGELLIMEEPGPLCLACADMDHLAFLASGDAALTRRAKAASTLSAVVVRFSRARKRYERQDILVEEDALAAAERSASPTRRRALAVASVNVSARRRGCGSRQALRRGDQGAVPRLSHRARGGDRKSRLRARQRAGRDAHRRRTKPAGRRCRACGGRVDSPRGH